MKRVRVMIVEDEEIVARDIASQLKTMGCGMTRTASSGEEAIRNAVRLRPDLVLMDIVLKGRIDGITVAEEIAKLDIPVIYLTSFADADTLSRAKVTRPYGYIVKPFKEDDLRTAVEIAVFRHNEEKRRNEREQLLKSALMCACSALIISDASMSIIFMNHAAEQMTGWKKEEALKRKVSEIFRILHDKKRRVLDDLAFIISRGGTPLSLREELTLLSKDGTEKKIQAGISSVNDSKDGTAGLVIVFHTLEGNDKETPPLSETMNIAYRKLAERPLDNTAAAILRSVSFIEQNLGERFTLEQIARSANMSKYHLSRLFKRLQGVSPMSFVNSVKMECAGTMLKQGTLTVSEVAASLGFNSFSHFTEQFKKVTGMTPSEYRVAAAKAKALK